MLYCELGAAAAAANLKRYKNLMLASFLLSHLFQRGGRDRSSSSSCLSRSRGTRAGGGRSDLELMGQFFARGGMAVSRADTNKNRWRLIEKYGIIRGAAIVICIFTCFAEGEFFSFDFFRRQSAVGRDVSTPVTRPMNFQSAFFDELI